MIVEPLIRGRKQRGHYWCVRERAPETIRLYRYLDRKHGARPLPRWLKIFRLVEVRKIFHHCERWWTPTTIRTRVARIFRDHGLITNITHGDAHSADASRRWALQPGLSDAAVRWLLSRRLPAPESIMVRAAEALRSGVKPEEICIDVAGRRFFLMSAVPPDQQGG